MDIKFVSKAIEKFIHSINNANNDEVEKIGNSITNWGFKRGSAYFVNESDLKKGQIIFTDFGLNYKPEMAYRHPSVIMKVKNHMCTVHPCTSNNSKVSKAYHPIYNPRGSRSYYLLKAGEGGLSKDTAVILGQILTISVGRIIQIYDINGLDSTVFANVCKESFKMNYEYQHHQMERLEKENSILKMQINAKIDKVEFSKNGLIPYETLVEYKNGTLCYNKISTEECGENEVIFYLKDNYGQKSDTVSIIIKII